LSKISGWWGVVCHGNNRANSELDCLAYAKSCEGWQGECFSTMNETPQSSSKDGKYYRLFVLAQAVMLFAFFGLREMAPRDRHGARVRKAFSDIKGGLKTVLEIFRGDCGRFPTTAEGWGVLMSAPADGLLTNWRGPYLDASYGVPTDPWGHPYVYRFPAVRSTNDYDLYSRGPDGVGESADDIGNWDKHSVPSSVTIANLIAKNEDWLLLIPLLFVAGMLAQLTFPNVRRTAREHAWVDWLWFAIALLTLIDLVTPRISG
jgi:general secretion pathway protein G